MDETARIAIRLSDMLALIDQVSGGAVKTEAQAAFDRRLITRSVYEDRLTSIVDTTQRQMRTQNELTRQRAQLKVERAKVEHLERLAALPADSDPRDIAAIAGSGGRELAVIGADILEAYEQVEHQGQVMRAARERARAFEDSRSLLADNRAALLATPAGRAITEPVNVLFVPYANLDAYEPGTPLYTCTFQIVWCSKVGVAVNAIDGESTIVHPLFGKPVRGVFVEARFDDRKHVEKELIHAGRAPLFL